jgi:hypothetical protein
VPRISAVPVLLLMAITVALGQSPDRHLNSSDSKILYERSTYAHGYMHGYEDGFHNADIDIHMGRGERPISQIKEFKECSGGYRPQFGDRQYFRLGFKQGFREGYTDAMQGRAFRAVAEVRKITDGLNAVPAAALSQREFDQAFSAGYDNGRDVAFQRPEVTADSVDATDLCGSKIPRSEMARKGNYCDAFTRGFSLGLSDGQASRNALQTQTAKKEASRMGH